jgi:predicted ATP-grasp superfamily ATP-dependent carboligase
MEVLAQQLIPGPEVNVESYHVYVDGHGDIAGEFTGRKIRTYPTEYGHSTAVETSNSPDVQALGREMVRRLGLRGVAKFDFKRGPDSKLYLLEINPRFNLWHHLGAAAGVNLPALVYSDLVRRPRCAARRATVGVEWCAVWEDAKATKAQGVSFFKWLPWMLRCETKSGMAWDDPMPFVRSKLWKRVSHLFKLMFHRDKLSRQIVNPGPQGTLGLNR